MLLKIPKIGLEKLQDEGFSTQILEGLQSVTRLPIENYDEFVQEH